MRTIVWWTVWGLVVAVGVVSLLEFRRSHYYLLLSIPLLTGALAAAVMRIEYEYKHALEHAKWAGISSLFLVGAVGFLYLKAHAYGPFSTGSPHKAILGTTFEMSVPEVERTLGRRLTEGGVETQLQEKAQEWILEALPLPVHQTMERYALPVMLYNVPCDAVFQFERRKLGRVELQFRPTDPEATTLLARKIREELAKDYQATDHSSRPLTYRKEAVQATVHSASADPNRYTLTVSLQYLPFTSSSPEPVVVKANVF